MTPQELQAVYRQGFDKPSDEWIVRKFTARPLDTHRALAEINVRLEVPDRKSVV